MKLPNTVPEKDKLSISIRNMQPQDHAAADHVMRLAFGTFLGMPEPLAFMGEADYVRTRWRANPDAAFCAEMDGRIIGSGFATNWGSVGFFGPLSSHPDVWDRGVGQMLMEPIMACFERWGTKHAGLFTFATSQKHIGLYQKFGFWPRYLTAIMSKPVADVAVVPQATLFSQVPDGQAKEVLDACRRFTDTVYEGLDITVEIEAVAAQALGDTVLLWDGSQLAGIAVCHCGPGSEAGANVCYIKVAVVRPGATAGKDFTDILQACERLAADKKLGKLSAGMNLARVEAYQQMQAYGFRTDRLGVAMQRFNEAGYNRPGMYIIDDWR